MCFIFVELFSFSFWSYAMLVVCCIPQTTPKAIYEMHRTSACKRAHTWIYPFKSKNSNTYILSPICVQFSSKIIFSLLHFMIFASKKRGKIYISILKWNICTLSKKKHESFICTSICGSLEKVSVAEIWGEFLIDSTFFDQYDLLCCNRIIQMLISWLKRNGREKKSVLAMNWREKKTFAGFPRY